MFELGFFSFVVVAIIAFYYRRVIFSTASTAETVVDYSTAVLEKATAISATLADNQLNNLLTASGAKAVLTPEQIRAGIKPAK